MRIRSRASFGVRPAHSVDTRSIPSRPTDALENLGLGGLLDLVEGRKDTVHDTAAWRFDLTASAREEWRSAFPEVFNTRVFLESSPHSRTHFGEAAVVGGGRRVDREPCSDFEYPASPGTSSMRCSTTDLVGRVTMADITKPPAPPKGLGPPGRALWRALNAEFVFAGAELHLLTEAARTADELDRLSAALVDAAPLVPGSAGQDQANPLFAEARQHRATLAALLAAMRLAGDDERAARRDADERPTPMRPGSVGWRRPGRR
jgi:hypothetical protein